MAKAILGRARTRDDSPATDDEIRALEALYRRQIPADRTGVSKRFADECRRVLAGEASPLERAEICRLIRETR